MEEINSHEVAKLPGQRSSAMKVGTTGERDREMLHYVQNLITPPGSL